MMSSSSTSNPSPSGISEEDQVTYPTNTSTGVPNSISREDPPPPRHIPEDKSGSDPMYSYGAIPKQRRAKGKLFCEV